jgi:hypothetical protein
VKKDSTRTKVCAITVLLNFLLVVNANLKDVLTVKVMKFIWIIRNAFLAALFMINAKHAQTKMFV